MTESRRSADWTERIWRLRPAATGRRAAGYGLAALAALVALDIVLGGQVAIVGLYLAAAFVPAFSGFRRPTMLVAATAVGAAVLSGTWNDNVGSTEYWTKIVLIALGGVTAILAAMATREGRIAFRRLEILDEVAAVTARDADGRRALDAITAVLVPELGDVCAIDLANDRGEVTRAAIGAAGPRAGEIRRVLAARRPSLPAEWLGVADVDLSEPRVFETFGPVELDAIAHDDEDLRQIEALDLASAVTVPLIARGHCTGTVTLIRTNPGEPYRSPEVRFAKALADRIALALDSAGLLSDLQSIEGQMNTAMGVLEEAVVIHDGLGDPVFANAAMTRMVGLEDADELEGLALRRLGESFDLFDEDGDAFDPAEFTAARLLRGQTAGPQTLRAMRGHDGAELWVRVRSGVVPGPDGRPLYVVTALEDITDLKRAELAQGLLARLGELLESSLGYERSVERLGELVVPQLADWCSVFETGEDGTIDEVATAHEDPARIAKARHLLADYPLSVADRAGPARVLRDGRTLVLDSIEPFLPNLARDDEHLTRLRDIGLGSIMVLPMRSGGRVLGAMVLGNESGGRRFDSIDQGLAERVAGRAAVALDNTRLTAERAEIAETLQQGLLPAPLPDIPGWAIAALYRPAGNQNQVGGDFYDAFPIEGGWMIVIGDVTGRGAHAASITGQARHTVRAAATITGGDPLITLATLNRTLLSRTKPALCSLAAVALETESRTARIAVAGHPPPLLAGPAGVREAGTTGPVLGAFPDAEWGLSSVEVQAGEQIIVYTDGVTEAEGSGGRFGEEQLRSQLEGVSAPGASIARIDEALSAFCGGSLDDDAAMLALSPVLQAAEWTTMSANVSSSSMAR